MTRDDIPSYTDEFWSAEARAELKAMLAGTTDAQCREILATLLSEPNPALLVAALRGAIVGMAKRGKE